MKCLSIVLFTILFAGSEPAHCASIEGLKDRIIFTYSRELKTSDAPPMEGFSIARSDLHFFPAKASYVKRQNEKVKLFDDKKKGLKPVRNL